MEDLNEEARGLAKYALGQLLQKDSSVESVVRSVLRIATLKEHSAWQVWAYLQLTEMFDDGDIQSATQAIAWGKIEAARQEDIVARALRDYNAARAEIADTSDVYRADVGDIERDLIVFEASLMREIDVTRFAQRDRNHRILNRIKNQAQEYLMMVEKNAAPPELGETS